MSGETFFFGAVFVAVLILFVWLMDMEIRMRNYESQLLLEKQKNADARIEARSKTLTDAELDALISDGVRRYHEETT